MTNTIDDNLQIIEVLREQLRQFEEGRRIRHNGRDVTEETTACLRKQIDELQATNEESLCYPQSVLTV